jgi:hypothetical protein
MTPINDYETTYLALATRDYLLTEEVSAMQKQALYTAFVERIPSSAFCLGPFAITLQISLAEPLIDDVMFAGNIEGVEFRLGDDLIGIVEFLGLRQVSDVPGVDHEGWLLRQSTRFSDCFFQRSERVRICWLLETDMTV